MKGRYIVVEGPIAVGKTSLAERLADATGARLVCEESEENPFLRRFYDDPDKYAFPAQIFFLLNRYRQQQALAQMGLFEGGIVADYMFGKDSIFARLNLNDEEFTLYQQIYQLLDTRIVRPDLVVYLDARSDVLWKRLKRRSRDYEKRLAPTYLERVAEAYRRFFHHYEHTPLLIVQSSDIDFVERSADLADLIREIDRTKKGVHNYVPIGER